MVPSAPASSPAASTVPAALQIFVTLHFLKDYPTYFGLQAMFVLNYRYIAKLVHRCLLALHCTLQHVLAMPDNMEIDRLKRLALNSSPQHLKHVLLAVDGTEIPIRRPADDDLQGSHYSVKKKQHALNMLAIVDLTGRFRWVSDVEDILQDQKLWNQLSIRDWFVEHQDVGLIADGGFHLNPAQSHAGPNLAPIAGVTPKRRKKSARQLRSLALDNSAISKVRVIVENSFARLKKWRILTIPMRHYVAHRETKLNPQLIVHTCVFLTNLLIEKSPCRKQRPDPSPWTIRSLIPRLF